MHRASLVIGVVSLLIGGVWTLQGAGILGGSVVTGQTFWAIVGSILLIVGIVARAWSPRGMRRPAV
jgi:hypothetical protein